MKHLVLLALPLALTGCAMPVETWINPGVEATRAERTLLGCEAEARQEFPVAVQSRVSTTITLGGRFCDGPFCLGAARGVPADTRPTDVNADLRARAVDLCMREAGFTKVSVPQCPTGITPLELERHPSTTAGICLADGAFALAP
jgi:hypothetical protein